jgi:hypothetical protein
MGGQVRFWFPGGEHEDGPHGCPVPPLHARVECRGVSWVVASVVFDLDSAARPFPINVQLQPVYP